MISFTRSVPVVLFVFYAGFIIFPSMVYGQVQTSHVNGIVFEDKNKNLQYDADEKGITGILVSNQVDVVKTDKDGRYELPVDQEEAIIFIIKPAGYLLPLNENNLPQFYYIHKPKGSSELKYPGIPPSGPLPEEVNFPLFKTFVSDTFD